MMQTQTNRRRMRVSSDKNSPNVFMALILKCEQCSQEILEVRLSLNPKTREILIEADCPGCKALYEDYSTLRELLQDCRESIKGIDIDDTPDSPFHSNLTH